MSFQALSYVSFFEFPDVRHISSTFKNIYIYVYMLFPPDSTRNGYKVGGISSQNGLLFPCMLFSEHLAARANVNVAVADRRRRKGGVR